MGNIDLHIHSINSDGEYSILELLRKIKRDRISYFSITDHDDIKSCFEMEKINLPSYMNYIPGVEFSTIMGDIKSHILGYKFDYNSGIILKECDKIRKIRFNRIKIILDYLEEKYDIYLTLEEKNLILNKIGTIGRTDIYKVLFNKGLGTREEIFDKYLTDLPFVPPYQSSSSHIISIIHDAGGKAIIAHPKEIEENYQINIEDVITNFLEMGIDGIEIYNSIHTLQDMKRYFLLSKKYDLLTTGGSDYHGPNVHSEIELGKTTTKKIRINSNYINL